jgi:hypothetical protein
MDEPREHHSAETTINLLNQYIKALSVNVNKAHLPTTLNIIFDSGAVNGIIAIGAALYIHNLEKMNYFKIGKISGCSIGSVIALWYCYGCPEDMYSYVEKLFTYYKQEKNFYIYEEFVNDIVNILIKNDDMSAINERLYINYYDTKKRKQKIISHFKNSQHLISCILKSSHVPFLTRNEYKYKGRYIDGIAPYIFADNTNDTKNLFIKLICITNPLQCMCVKTEQNIYSRLLRGVIGVNDFFMNGNSSLCSYVSDKKYCIRMQLYTRKCFVLFIIYLIDKLIIMKNNIPLDVIAAVQTTALYSKCIAVSKDYWYVLQNKLV